jgi:very-short-patch-repair endonuclease
MDDVFGAGEWHREQLVFKWTVDAAVLKLRLAVQADGDYWHGLLPGSANDPRVAGNIANDRRQERYLHAAGWTVLRFWESELLRRPDDCRRELLYARGATGLPAGVDSAT